MVEVCQHGVLSPQLSESEADCLPLLSPKIQGEYDEDDDEDEYQPGIGGQWKILGCRYSKGVLTVVHTVRSRSRRGGR